MSSANNPPNGKRSIDERIEAILLAVELNHADHEARIAKLEAIAESIPRIEAILHKTEGHIQKILNIQESLAGIALDHESRLKRMEGQQ